MRCINEIITFDMNKMFEQSKENYNLKILMNRSLLISGLVTSNGESGRDGRSIQPGPPG